MKTHRVGYLLAIIAVIFWSGNFIVARNINGQISPVSLSFWRWFVATLFILPFFIPSIRQRLKIFKLHWKYLVITALMGVTTFNTFLYIAAQTTATINLALIAISYPIFTIILMRMISHEKIKPNQIVGIVLVLSGVITLLVRGQFERLLTIELVSGDLWMLSAAFLFAIYSILVKNKPSEIDNNSFIFLSFSSGLLCLLPVFILDPNHTYVWRYDSTLLWSIAYVALGPSILCYLCWNRAIGLIGAINTALIYYTLPIFSGIAGHLFLNEQIGLLHIICSSLIVGGIIMASVKKRIKKL